MKGEKRGAESEREREKRMSRCGVILASKVQTVTGRSNFVLSCLPKQVRKRGSRGRGKKNHTGQREGEREAIVLRRKKGESARKKDADAD